MLNTCNSYNIVNQLIPLLKKEVIGKVSLGRDEVYIFF